MQELTISGLEVQIANMNTRTEKHGEDDVGAMDVSIKFEADAAMLHTILGAPLNLWTDDNAQHVLVPGMEIKPSTVFENHRVRLAHVVGDDTIVLPNCDIGKFKVEPQSHGTAEVAAKIQTEASAQQVGEVFDRLGAWMLLHIEPRQAGLDLGEGEAA